MTSAVRLALVIPTYNYAEGILTTLQRLARWQSRQSKLAVEVIFSDDGSRDGTPGTIARFIAEQGLPWRLVQSTPNRGKGAVVRDGIFAAYDRGPDIIVFSDCDLHYGLDIITERMVPLLSSAAGTDGRVAQSDIVIVDRSLQGHDPALPRSRHFASALFNRLVALLTGITIKDTQAGLKGFRARECRPLFDVLQLNSFAFDVELLSVAQYHRYRITQIPVSYANKPMDYQSSVSLLPAALQMTADLLRINRNWKRGCYDSEALTQRLEATRFMIDDA